MRKLPNILTISRVFLTMAFIFFLTKSGLFYILVSIVLFTLASASDFLDGYYAKKHNVVSNFGKIMDPIADKFLILAAFFIFVRMNIIAAWMFYVIFTREFVVTGARFLAMRKGQVLAAEQAGKLKTVLQMCAISVILLFLVFQEADLLSRQTSGLWGYGINFLMSLTVFLTLFSGLSSLWNNRQVFLS